MRLRGWATRLRAAAASPFASSNPGCGPGMFGRLLLERLEERTVPSVFTVINLGDTGEWSGTSGDLRYCISQANADEVPATIQFQPGLTGTILLQSSLEIDTDLTINGPGVGAVTVGRAPGELPQFSNFTIDSGVTANLSGLTIADGVSDFGGGVTNFGTLTVDHCRITNNSAGQQGGGIFSEGTLIVRNSTIDLNQASQGQGGGIWAGFGNGLTIDSSTISQNMADAGGGLLVEDMDGETDLTNCTISGNVANSTGGGIEVESFESDPLTRLHFCTIASNSAPNGAGLYNFTASFSPQSIVHYDNTLFANHGANVDNEGGTLVSDGHNLSTDGSGELIAPTDLPNAFAGLAPLLDNGGPTMTQVLLPGSMALNKGAPSSGVTQDQRGIARAQQGAFDIGAFEARPYSLTLLAGDDQTTHLNTTFATPFQVRLEEGNNPLQDATVEFIAPSSGASGTFSSGSNGGTVYFAMTDASGIATASPFQANGVIGDYTVMARVAGHSTVFHESNVNQPIVAAGQDQFLDVGEVLQRTVTFKAAGSQPRTANVNYGDGTTQEIPLAANQRSFILSHQYTQEGSFLVSVAVTDPLTPPGSANFYADVLLSGVDTHLAKKVAVESGHEETVSEPGVTGTLFVGGPEHRAILIVAVVPQTVAATLPDQGGQLISVAYDVRTLNIMPGDYAVIVFTYQGTGEIQPSITFLDEDGLQHVPQGSLVRFDSFDVNTNTHTIKLVLDGTSQPALVEMTHTVFTITIPENVTVPSTTVTTFLLPSEPVAVVNSDGPTEISTTSGTSTSARPSSSIVTTAASLNGGEDPAQKGGGGQSDPLGPLPTGGGPATTTAPGASLTPSPGTPDDIEGPASGRQGDEETRRQGDKEGDTGSAEMSEETNGTDARQEGRLPISNEQGLSLARLFKRAGERRWQQERDQLRALTARSLPAEEKGPEARREWSAAAIVVGAAIVAPRPRLVRGRSREDDAEVVNLNDVEVL